MPGSFSLDDDAADAAPQSRPLTKESLPPLARSLLKIRAPAVTSLARTRMRVQQIVSLAPGSLIHFSKRCDEMLELEVAGQVIALGEAVKVGDKFGLRITSMKLPDERFHPLRPDGANP
jgi:flagellar motor switch/type III secretory pathway protein FliN